MIAALNAGRWNLHFFYIKESNFNIWLTAVHRGRVKSILKNSRVLKAAIRGVPNSCVSVAWNWLHGIYCWCDGWQEMQDKFKGWTAFYALLWFTPVGPHHPSVRYGAEIVGQNEREKTGKINKSDIISPQQHFSFISLHKNKIEMQVECTELYSILL